jgi:hypothetical protein
MREHSARGKQVTLNHWVIGSIPTRCKPREAASGLDLRTTHLKLNKIEKKVVCHKFATFKVHK